jgi:hypothetical protein
MHIAAGLTCVVSGTAAALSPRRRGRHPGLEPLLPVARGGVRLRGPGWPHCAGRRMPTCWSSAPCRLPPPPLAGLPGVDGGDGIAGAGTDSYESMSHMHGHGIPDPLQDRRAPPVTCRGAPCSGSEGFLCVSREDNYCGICGRPRQLPSRMCPPTRRMLANRQTRPTSRRPIRRSPAACPPRRPAHTRCGRPLPRRPRGR